MPKYFCDDYGDRGVYSRGLCGNDDYSQFIIVNTTQDLKNNYLTAEGRPRYKWIKKDNVFIDSPLIETQEEIEEKEKKNKIKILSEQLPVFMVENDIKLVDLLKVKELKKNE